MKKAVSILFFGAIIALAIWLYDASRPTLGINDVEHCGFPQPEMVTLGSGYLKGPAYYPMDQVASNNSSVSVKDGQYSIDTAIIYSDLNKKALVAALEKEKLEEKKRVEEIPDFIKFFLDSLAGKDKFQMANPGEEFQVGWFPNKNAPDRQLVYFALGKNIAILSFYSSGMEKSQHVGIMRFENEQVVDFWFENELCTFTTKEKLIERLKRDPAKGNC